MRTSLLSAGNNEADLPRRVRGHCCKGVVHRGEQLGASVHDTLDQRQVEPQAFALRGYHPPWRQNPLHVLQNKNDAGTVQSEAYQPKHTGATTVYYCTRYSRKHRHVDNCHLHGS